MESLKRKHGSNVYDTLFNNSTSAPRAKRQRLDSRSDPPATPNTQPETPQGLDPALPAIEPTQSETSQALDQAVPAMQPAQPERLQVLDQAVPAMGPTQPVQTNPEVADNTKGQGTFRVNATGGLEHFLESSKTWIPAVYHQNIRAELIREASLQGSYKHPRKQGLGETDATSFLLTQKSWGEHRDDWPEVLFTLDIKKTPKNPSKVPLWYRNGMVVLDRNSNPMRDLPALLPATCSSAMEEWLLVAIFHSDRRVQINDVYARMPSEVVLPNEQGTTSLFTTNTLSMRMTRFRLEAGLLPREQRCGSDAIVEGYKHILGERCFLENSTRSFGRNLKPEEIKKVKRANKGKYSQKSRTKHLKSETGTPTKRKREDSEDNLLSQEQNVENEEPFPKAKRACGQNPRKAVNALVVNASTRISATGLPTPVSTFSSYPNSQSGTPETTAWEDGIPGPSNDVWRAANREDESFVESGAPMFPDLYSTNQSGATGAAGSDLLEEFDTLYELIQPNRYLPPDDNHSGKILPASVSGSIDSTISLNGQKLMASVPTVAAPTVPQLQDDAIIDDETLQNVMDILDPDWSNQSHFESPTADSTLFTPYLNDNDVVIVEDIGLSPQGRFIPSDTTATSFTPATIQPSHAAPGLPEAGIPVFRDYHPAPEEPASTYPTDPYSPPVIADSVYRGLPFPEAALPAAPSQPPVPQAHAQTDAEAAARGTLDFDFFEENSQIEPEVWR